MGVRRERVICGRALVLVKGSPQSPELMESVVDLLRTDAESRGLDLTTEADLTWREIFFRYEGASTDAVKVECPEDEAEFIWASVEASYMKQHPRPTLKEFLIRNAGMNQEGSLV